MSNSEHIRWVTQKILNHGPKSVGFIGLSFKSGCQDQRGSAVIELATALAKTGIDILILKEEKKPFTRIIYL